MRETEQACSAVERGREGWQGAARGQRLPPPGLTECSAECFSDCCRDASSLLQLGPTCGFFCISFTSAPHSNSPAGGAGWGTSVS